MRVELLWESGDPQQVLRERFGFGSGRQAGAWIRQVVRGAWQVQVGEPTRILLSHTNGLAWLPSHDGPLIAKWSVDPDRFDALRQSSDLAAGLAARGLPVSRPVPTADGSWQVEVDECSIGVQWHLDGDLLDVSDPDQVDAAGVLLAQLHVQAAALDGAPPTPVIGSAADRIARIRQWLAAAGDHLPDHAVRTLAARLAHAPAQPLPEQIVHGDFRSANLLWREGRICGVLDLESTRRDWAVDELARSAVLLGTQYRDWGPVGPEVRLGLLAGYDRVRELSTPERFWFDTLTLWYSLAFIPAEQDRTGWARAAAALAVSLGD